MKTPPRPERPNVMTAQWASQCRGPLRTANTNAVKSRRNRRGSPQQSHHPELAGSKLILFSFSGGGSMVARMVAYAPDRILVYINNPHPVLIKPVFVQGGLLSR